MKSYWACMTLIYCIMLKNTKSNHLHVDSGTAVKLKARTAEPEGFLIITVQILAAEVSSGGDFDGIPMKLYIIDNTQGKFTWPPSFPRLTFLTINAIRHFFRTKYCFVLTEQKVVPLFWEWPSFFFFLYNSLLFNPTVLFVMYSSDSIISLLIPFFFLAA